MAIVLLSEQNVIAAPSGEIKNNTRLTEEASARFSATFKGEGMRGVGEMIAQCYISTTDNWDNRQMCIMQDLAAREIDQAMRNTFVGMGKNDPGPASPVLAPKADAMRDLLYINPKFGSLNAAYRYYRQAVNFIMAKWSKG